MSAAMPMTHFTHNRIIWNASLGNNDKHMFSPASINEKLRSTLDYTNARITSKMHAGAIKAAVSGGEHKVWRHVPPMPHTYDYMDKHMEKYWIKQFIRRACRRLHA